MRRRRRYGGGYRSYPLLQADGGYYRRRHRINGLHVCRIMTVSGATYVECIYAEEKPIRWPMPKCLKCPVVCKNKNKKPIKKCDKCEHKFKCWTGEYSKKK